MVPLTRYFMIPTVHRELCDGVICWLFGVNFRVNFGVKEALRKSGRSRAECGWMERCAHRRPRWLPGLIATRGSSPG